MEIFSWNRSLNKTSSRSQPLRASPRPGRLGRSWTRFASELAAGSDSGFDADQDVSGHAPARHWIPTRKAPRSRRFFARTRVLPDALDVFSFRSRILSRLFIAMVFESIRNCSQSILQEIAKSPASPQMSYDLGVCFTNLVLGPQASSPLLMPLPCGATLSESDL